MDLKIKDVSGKFKVRVNGVVINDGKILGLQMNDCVYFCFPGGHIHLGENSKNAVLREMKEETGLEFESANLIAVVENFFEGNEKEKFHEISFCYLMKAKNLNEKANDFDLVENDEGNLIKMQYKWFDLNELENVDLRPAVLKQKLKNKNFNLEHIIFENNKVVE